MFNNISWANYAVAITILLLVYYGLVLILYYRNDFGRYLSKLKPSIPGDQQSLEIVNLDPSEESKNGTQKETLAELLLSLQLLLQTAAARAYPKEELLLSLQLQIKEHRSHTQYADKEVINNFIISECKSHCSMHLDEFEVKSLWG